MFWKCPKKSNFNANILNNSFLFFIFAIFYCQNVKKIKIQGKNQLVLIYYNCYILLSKCQIYQDKNQLVLIYFICNLWIIFVEYSYQCQ
jgi:hypothetical protein